MQKLFSPEMIFTCDARLFGLLLIFLLAFSLIDAAFAAENESKIDIHTYHNPILSGFHPDPSICRAGDDFYLTNSTFEMFPGLPIYHSRDLVHWEQIGNALTRPSQLPLKGATDFGGLYAPTLRYWNGLFYLTCDNMTHGGNFIVTAKDPAGPWSEPMWMDDFHMDGSMLFDDDNKAYYTAHFGDAKGGIGQAEFDPITGKLTTPMKVIYNDLNEEWNEGPHLYKINGLYYLMLAEGGTGTSHTEFIARSKSPWGPFEPCPYNPILTERDDPKSPIQCTGHGDLVEAPDKTWWMVFLGTRPQNGTSVLGRETFLAPVQWTKDGWPVVNGDHHVAVEMQAPNLKPFSVPKTPKKWLFNVQKLGPEWIHVRNIDPSYFSLSEHKGYLRLKAAKDSLDNKEDTPAFVGQRQPSFRFLARTAMVFKPGQDGEEAGLCVRANDFNYYEIALAKFNGKLRIFVKNRVKAKNYTVASQPFIGSKVMLQITGDESQYQFAWSKNGKTWNTIAASAADDLSREKAGGFTGAAIGLYASANGKDSGSFADFSWFEMTPADAPSPMALSPRPTPTALPASDAWRIRAGGKAMTDKSGNTWAADIGYDGGETAITGEPIQGAVDQALYQTERWGNDFTYSFQVLPGEYRVTLKFAEVYLKNPGDRVFDVFINGQKMLDHFDILKEAGGFAKAIDRSFDGIKPDADQIRIHFVSSVQNAKVCSIEIIRTDNKPQK
jgi:alpha-N-arabinofuranosidase